VQWKADFWQEVIDGNGLEVAKDDQPTHYWTGEDHPGESVIDLTLANRPITKWVILDHDHTTGSHHEVVGWEVEADMQEEADHERVVGWNIAAMKEEDPVAAEKLWAELVMERAHLDAEYTADEVEQEATCCQDAVSSPLNANANMIRICAKSKLWWNANIKSRRKGVRIETRRRRHSEEDSWAQAELQMSIAWSNSQMWNDNLPNVKGAEVWRTARYANASASMTVEPVTDKNRCR
jgi:hypothetical protein